MMKALNCVAIDDEDLDLLMVVSCIGRFPQLRLSGSFDSPRKALDSIDFGAVDVLFLDIDMPGINGLELRKRVEEVPVCVFITSHPEYALDSFHVETLDFIVKPLTLDRFRQTVERIDLFMDIRQKANLYDNRIGGGHIIIREGHEETKVPIHEIHFLEALKEYTFIHTDQKRFCVLSNLGKLLAEPSLDSFVRIHKSFAVRKDTVKTRRSSELVLDGGQKLPIGRRYKDDVNALFA